MAAGGILCQLIKLKEDNIFRADFISRILPLAKVDFLLYLWIFTVQATRTQRHSSTLSTHRPEFHCGWSCSEDRTTRLFAQSQFNRKAQMGRVPAAFTFTFAFLLFSLLINTADSSSSSNNKIPCSKACVAMNCDTVGIKYGKYCGVGHSGCPGEKACDDLDACCQIHDDCVGKHGMTNIKCREKFKKCGKKVHKSGKAGFLKDCPYDVAVPTMVQGMDFAILMSQMACPKLEL